LRPEGGLVFFVDRLSPDAPALLADRRMMMSHIQISSEAEI
jgi:hypothetical protein